MDVCDHCGRLYLLGLHALVLVELEDEFGIWHEWLDGHCIDELLNEDDDDVGDDAAPYVVRYSFTLPSTA